ncbi:MAG: FecR family protein [Pedobacter sp.]|nr:MAG: FecR family protein [Pedobacter sp.]
MSRKSEALIKKYLDNTCTPEERAVLESWYNEGAQAEEDALDDADYEQLDKDIWKALKKANKPVQSTNWSLIAAAAACLVTCFVFYYLGRKPPVQEFAVLKEIILPPGGNKAELVLEDGSVLPLSDDKAGLLTNQNGARITNFEGGILSYNISEMPISGISTFNILKTPRGGQYQVKLPDGTRVWLNAASSLKFPTVFNTLERVVELSGEAYFEVAVDKHKPFKVISKGQTVAVLGTHFNINAYPDELVTSTILIEGSVKVASGKETLILKPGQQTILNNKSEKLDLYNVDTQEALAWKQGYFQFNDEDVKSIMRKLSRWYDLEVIYSNDFINQRFSGSVSRFEDASKVMKMLEYTGTVHFKAEGRRVTVMP